MRQTTRQTKLLRWYRRTARPLPWRQNPTPYHIWISEIMLQQTTVKTVLPHYRRFLKRFPSLKSLAAAKMADVLTAWSGLGYYSRARNLHRAAQICAEKYRGKLPRDLETLKNLPGIGPYTAGAIASIAFREPAPILDGNVTRVLARLFLLNADPKSAQGKRLFWHQAAAILPERRCGDFNQALMELGATICTPTQPLCSLCPLACECLAFRQVDPTAYPQNVRKLRYCKVNMTAALVSHSHHLFMVQRPTGRLLGELWEFPIAEGDLTALQTCYGLNLRQGRRLAPVRHTITNRRITVTPWWYPVAKRTGTHGCKIGRWIPRGQIDQLPVSSLVQKLVATLPEN